MSPATAVAVRRRPLGSGDADAVLAAVRSSFLLGAPLPEVGAWDTYATLTVGWYLGPGAADAAVIEDDEGPVGHVLVCADHGALRRWQRRHLGAHLRAVARASLTRGDGGVTRRFHRDRALDGLRLMRAPEPAPAHAHLCILPRGRFGATGLAARDHVDAVVARAGLASWFGEVNARAGHRAGALERLVGPVVHRAPNATMTRLLGEPVERLTVVRRLR